MVYLTHSSSIRLPCSAAIELQGVTIPSQKRYVCYYDQLIKMRPMEYKETPMFLQGIRLRTIPDFPNLSEWN